MSNLPDSDPRQSESRSSRRSFLKWSGAAGATALAFGSKFPQLDLAEAFAQRGVVVEGAVDVSAGGGDIAILNFAYALEQLASAFYTLAVANPYRGMSAYEQQILVGIRDHEIAHREFFKNALGPNRIPDLQPNFSRVNFRNRLSVLTTARTFEDLDCLAYNGAGPLLRDPAHLAAAGSIVSVEARHAAALREILRPFSPAFAGDDVVNNMGLGLAGAPSQVLATARPYLATPVVASQLP